LADSQDMSTSNSYVKYHISVYQNSQSTTNNTSQVTVDVYFWRTNSGYQTYGDGNLYVTVDGTTYTQAISSSQKITESGIILFSQTFTINHNSDGTKTLTCSAYINLSGVLTSSNQSFSYTLTQIARRATISSISPSDLTGNTSSITVNFYNQGNFDLQFKIEYALSSSGSYSDLFVFNKPTKTSPYVINLTESMLDQIGALYPNTAPGYLRITIGTYISGGSTPDDWDWVDKIFVLAGSKPVFSSGSVAYQDINSAVTSITGNNQLIVQKKSTMQVSWPAATAQRGASLVSYKLIFLSSTITTSASASLYNVVNTYLNTSSDFTLTVRATDSRGYYTSLTKTVTVAALSVPVIEATCTRLNNYESQCTLHVNATVSSVSGTNSITALYYKYKKTTDTTYSDPVNISNNTDVVFNLDNNYAWDVSVTCTDAFNYSATIYLKVSKGIPLVFFDTNLISLGINKFPSNNNSLECNNSYCDNLEVNTALGTNLKLLLLNFLYPVGVIYMTINSANPSTYFGGTWSLWGSGRVPVCVNTSDSNFNTVEETGGASTVTLTTSQIPSHTHTVPGWNSSADSSNWQPAGSSRWTGTYWNYTTEATGGGSSHNNLQPYITCYMWKRTA